MRSRLAADAVSDESAWPSVLVSVISPMESSTIFKVSPPSFRNHYFSFDHHPLRANKQMVSPVSPNLISLAAAGTRRGGWQVRRTDVAARPLAATVKSIRPCWSRPAPLKTSVALTMPPLRDSPFLLIGLIPGRFAIGTNIMSDAHQLIETIRNELRPLGDRNNPSSLSGSTRGSPRGSTTLKNLRGAAISYHCERSP
jgi:hypothetical protein